MTDKELIKQLQTENLHLKEVLFCCGEIAVSSFDDTIVGLVDKTLKGFQVPKIRFIEILKELKQDT